MSVKPRTIPTKQLAQNLSSTGLTMYLNNTEDWDGAQLSSTDFGTQAFAILRNSSNSQIEIIEINPATVDATATITIIKRALGYDGTQVDATETAYNWLAGDTFVELGSDSPQLMKQLVEETTDETIAGVKTFSSVPKTTGGNPVDATDLVRKAYVDTLLAGIASTVSIIVEGTAGENVAAGNLVYLKSADGKWWKSDADTASTVDNVILGIAQGTGTADGAIASGVLLQGLDANQSSLTPSATYYASNTGGGISAVAGTTEVTVGIAKSATQLYFNPRFNQGITENIQDALEGTSGTPSATNKYVTNDDTSATSANDKLVRANGSGKIADGFLPITAANATDLTDGGDTTIHYHKRTFGCTQCSVTGSGTQNIAHGLGVTPKYVKARLMQLGGSNTVIWNTYSEVLFNGSTYSGFNMASHTNNVPIYEACTDALVKLQNADSGLVDTIKGTATLDATNIAVTWTNGATSYYVIWEAFA